MPKFSQSPELTRVVQLLARLPGLGPRSARRAVIHLLKRKDALMEPLASALLEAARAIRRCGTCNNLDTDDPCTICRDPTRAPHQITVVEDVGDLWALERATATEGTYHVLGGALSALEGITAEQLAITQLVTRAKHETVEEIILATSATIDGQTTAHYLLEQLRSADVKISRMAHGVPVGGELDYLDDGTLAAAIRQRTGY